MVDNINPRVEYLVEDGIQRKYEIDLAVAEIQPSAVTVFIEDRSGEVPERTILTEDEYQITFDEDNVPHVLLNETVEIGLWVVIQSALQFGQATDYVEGTSLPPEVLEGDLDRLHVLGIQSLDTTEKTVRAAYDDPLESARFFLPSQAQRANKYLYFGDDGEVTVSRIQGAGLRWGESTTYEIGEVVEDSGVLFRAIVALTTAGQRPSETPLEWEFYNAREAEQVNVDSTITAPIDEKTVFVDTSGGPIALTLEDGNAENQKLNIVVVGIADVSVSGTGILVASSYSQGLIWDGTAWYVRSNAGITAIRQTADPFYTVQSTAPRISLYCDPNLNPIEVTLEDGLDVDYRVMILVDNLKYEVRVIGTDLNVIVSDGAEFSWNGSKWIVAGSGGDTDVQENKDMDFAIGTAFPFFGPADQIASGMIAALGQLLNINDYPKLFRKYGTLYGGDGVTTFGIPNLQGVGLRGLGTQDVNGNLKGKADGTVGEIWEDEIEEHMHHSVTTNSAGFERPIADPDDAILANVSGAGDPDYTLAGAPATADLGRSSNPIDARIGTETHGTDALVHWVIYVGNGSAVLYDDPSIDNRLTNLENTLAVVTEPPFDTGWVVLGTQGLGDSITISHNLGQSFGQLDIKMFYRNPNIPSIEYRAELFTYTTEYYGQGAEGLGDDNSFIIRFGNYPAIQAIHGAIGAVPSTWEYKVIVTKKSASAPLIQSNYAAFKDWVEVWNDGGADNIPSVSKESFGEIAGRYKVEVLCDIGGSSVEFELILNIKDLAGEALSTSYTGQGTSTEIVVADYNRTTSNSIGVASQTIGPVRIKSIFLWQDTLGANKPSKALGDGWEEIYYDENNSSFVSVDQLSEFSAPGYYAFDLHSTASGLGGGHNSVFMHLPELKSGTTYGSAVARTSTSTTGNVAVRFDEATREFYHESDTGITAYYIKAIYKFNGMVALDVNHTNVHIEGDNSIVHELDTNAGSIAIGSAHLPFPIPEGFTATFVNSGVNGFYLTSEGSDITTLPPNIYIADQQALRLVGVNNLWRAVEGQYVDPVLKEKDWVTVWEDSPVTIISGLDIYNGIRLQVTFITDSSLIYTQQLTIEDITRNSYTADVIGTANYTQIEYSASTGNLTAISNSGSNTFITKVEKWEQISGLERRPRNPVLDGWETVWNAIDGDKTPSNVVPSSEVLDFGLGRYEIQCRRTNGVPLDDVVTFYGHLENMNETCRFGITANSGNTFHVEYDGANSQFEITGALGSWTTAQIVKICKFKGIADLNIEHSNVHVEGDNSVIHDIDTSSGSVVIDSTYLPDPVPEGYTAVFVNAGNAGNLVTTFGTDVVGLPDNITILDQSATKLIGVNGLWRVLESNIINTADEVKDWVTKWDNLTGPIETSLVNQWGYGLFYVGVRYEYDGNSERSNGVLAIQDDGIDRRFVFGVDTSGGDSTLTVLWTAATNTFSIDQTDAGGDFTNFGLNVLLKWESVFVGPGATEVTPFSEDLTMKVVDGWVTVYDDPANTSDVGMAMMIDPGDGYYQFVLSDGISEFNTEMTLDNLDKDTYSSNSGGGSPKWVKWDYGLLEFTTENPAVHIIKIRKFKGIQRLDLNYPTVQASGTFGDSIYNLETSSGDVSAAIHFPDEPQNGERVTIRNAGSGGNYVIDLPGDIKLSDNHVIVFQWIYNAWTYDPEQIVERRIDNTLNAALSYRAGGELDVLGVYENVSTGTTTKTVNVDLPTGFAETPTILFSFQSDDNTTSVAEQMLESVTQSAFTANYKMVSSTSDPVRLIYTALGRWKPEGM